jgi:mannonate dehydratase
MNDNNTFLNRNRRCFLKTTAAALAGALGAMSAHAGAVLRNPCLNPALGELADSPWLAQVWQGLDPAQVWDSHVHLAGTGDSHQGLVVGPKLTSLWHPLLNIQRLFYVNASCSKTKAGTVDETYILHLATLAQSMPAGFKTLLFAFDWQCDETGTPVVEKSTFYVPNDYARKAATAHPDVFEWAASIHPYRPDAVDQLHAAAAGGAKAVKWLPAAQNIDPDSPRCNAFFAALAQLKLPLITHCGAEQATVAGGLEYLGNPLKLRRALDVGVQVVVAHCASYGDDEDLDKPGTHQPSFALFTRMMDKPVWQKNLRGDISAIVLRNRKPEVIKTLLTRTDWHGRLLNGSDYPLPGILPIISPNALASDGLLAEGAVAMLKTLRDHNPLYFDFALKRLLSWQGKTFPAAVFETRAFFEPQSS